MASQVIPTVKLNSNQEIPIIGLGTWKADPEETIEAVKNAIDAGYMLFDCAILYGNEGEVGQAIKSKIDEGVVKREDLCICSKLWATFHKREAVIPALKKSLSSLGTDYLDLYLLHTPFAVKEGGAIFPTDPDDSTILSDVDYLETWEGMKGLWILDWLNLLASLILTTNNLKDSSFSKCVFGGYTSSWVAFQALH